MDYCGYHLAENQMDLTPLQFAFIAQGRAELYKKMNSTDEESSKEINKQNRKDIFAE